MFIQGRTRFYQPAGQVAHGLGSELELAIKLYITGIPNHPPALIIYHHISLASLARQHRMTRRGDRAPQSVLEKLPENRGKIDIFFHCNTIYFTLYKGSLRVPVQN